MTESLENIDVDRLMADLVREACFMNAYHGAWARSAPKPGRNSADDVSEAQFRFPLHAAAIERVTALCSAHEIPVALEEDVLVVGDPVFLRLKGGEAARARAHYRNFTHGTLVAMARQRPAMLRSAQALFEAWRAARPAEALEQVPAATEDFRVAGAREGVFDVVAATLPSPRRLEESYGCIVAVSTREPRIGFIAYLTMAETVDGEAVRKLHCQQVDLDRPSASPRWFAPVTLRGVPDEGARVRPEKLLDIFRRSYKERLEAARPMFLELCRQLDAPAFVWDEREPVADHMLRALSSGRICGVIAKPGSGRSDFIRQAVQRCIGGDDTPAPAYELPISALPHPQGAEDLATTLRAVMQDAARRHAILVFSDLSLLIDDPRHQSSFVHLLRTRAGQPGLPLVLILTPEQHDRLVKVFPEAALLVEPVFLTDLSKDSQAEAFAEELKGYAITASSGPDVLARQLVETADRHDHVLGTPGRACRLMNLVLAELAADQGLSADPALIERVARGAYGLGVRATNDIDIAAVQRVEARLGAQIKGQDPALREIASALRYAALGMQGPHAPLASMIFAGWSGVGKTECSRIIADALFDDPDGLIKLDMAEFHDRHTVSRLTGAPPGYVGYSDGGQLSKPMLDNPHRVVLFDEVEKADPSIMDVLLQILDDGKLTDGRGRTLDFTHAVIILTTNLGTRDLVDALRKPTMGFGPAQESPDEDTAVTSAIQDWFRPEVLGRIERTIRFGRLMERDLVEILGQALREAAGRLARQRITLDVDPHVLTVVARASDPAEGARGAFKALRKLVLDPALAHATPGDVLTLRPAADGEIAFDRRAA